MKAFLFVAIAFLIGNCGYFKQRQISGIQNTVKGDLLLLADKELAFKSKHGFFTTDLYALDAAPPSITYKFGFTRPSTDTPSGADVKPERLNLEEIKKIPGIKLDFSPVTKLDQISFPEAAKACGDCTASRDRFKAIAVANLDGDADLDIWTIDHEKQIRHVQDDLSR